MSVPEPADDALEVESASSARLVGRAVDRAGLIVRQELALAKAEFARKARRVVLGSVLSAAAAAIAFVSLLCGVGAGVAGLAGLVPNWAAALIAAAVLAVGAALAGAAAGREFSRAGPSAPLDVVAGVKADVAEIKE